jgi:acyl-CoA thioester hydrolase
MRKILYEVRIPMRYGDMDSNGHINNVSTFKYFEEGRVQWFASMGLVADGTGAGPVIVETSANFLAELHYPGDVLVRGFVKRLGNTSCTVDQEIARQDNPDEVITKGTCTIVWFDHETRKPIPLPVEVRDVLIAAQ